MSASSDMDNVYTSPTLDTTANQQRKRITVINPTEAPTAYRGPESPVFEVQEHNSVVREGDDDYRPHQQSTTSLVITKSTTSIPSVTRRTEYRTVTSTSSNINIANPSVRSRLVSNASIESTLPYKDVSAVYGNHKGWSKSVVDGMRESHISVSSRVQELGVVHDKLVHSAQSLTSSMAHVSDLVYDDDEAHYGHGHKHNHNHSKPPDAADNEWTSTAAGPSQQWTTSSTSLVHSNRSVTRSMITKSFTSLHAGSSVSLATKSSHHSNVKVIDSSSNTGGDASQKHFVTGTQDFGRLAQLPERSANATPLPCHNRSDSHDSAPHDADHVQDVVIVHDVPKRHSTVSVPAKDMPAPRRSTDSAKSAPSDFDHVPDSAPAKPIKRQSVIPTTQPATEYGSKRQSVPVIQNITPRRMSMESVDSAPSQVDHEKAATVPRNVAVRLSTAASEPDHEQHRISKAESIESAPSEVHYGADADRVQRPNSVVKDQPKECEPAMGPIKIIRSSRPHSLESIPSISSDQAPAHRAATVDEGCAPVEKPVRLSLESVHSAPSELDHTKYPPFMYGHEGGKPVNSPLETSKAPAKVSMESIDLAPSQPPPPHRAATLDVNVPPVPVDDCNPRHSRESTRSAPSVLGGGEKPRPHGQPLPIAGGGRPIDDVDDEDAVCSCTSKFFINLIILLAWIAGAVFAITHHLFLTAIDNRDVIYYSQFWVKNATNAFSQAVSISLGLAVTLSISEGVWKYVKAQTVPEDVTSDLFSLPDTMTIFAFLRRRWVFTWSILVSLAIIYQLLAFVSMFAPNSLSVGPMPVVRDIAVPALNFSTTPADTANIIWPNFIQRLMISNLSDAWNVPSACGVRCTFDVEYQAPGLSCRDLRSDEITLKAYDASLLDSTDGWVFYESPKKDQLSLNWGRDDLNLSFSYVPMTSQDLSILPSSVTASAPAGGQLCHFQDMTYQATFTFVENQRFVSTSPVPDSSDVDHNCDWSSSSPSQDCSDYSTNAINLVNGFTSPFEGTMSWKDIGIVDERSNPDAMADLIQFVNNTSTGTVALAVMVTNMSQSLEEMFANATLGALLTFDGTKTASVHVEDGNAWVYDRRILWILYAPALGLSLIAIFYGLYCSINNPLSNSRKLSDFLGSIHRDQAGIRSRARATMEDVRSKANATVENLRHNPFSDNEKNGTTTSAATADQSGQQNNTAPDGAPLRVNMKDAFLLYEPASANTLLANGGTPNPSATQSSPTAEEQVPHNSGQYNTAPTSQPGQNDASNWMASLFDTNPKPSQPQPTQDTAATRNQAAPSTSANGASAPQLSASDFGSNLMKEFGVNQPDQPKSANTHNPGSDSVSTNAGRNSTAASHDPYARNRTESQFSRPSLAGSQKPSTVTFSRAALDRTTSDDVIVHAQRPGSIYDRMMNRNWSEASVTTNAKSTATHGQSNEALVGGKEQNEKSGGLFGRSNGNETSGKKSPAKGKDRNKVTWKDRIDTFWTELVMIGFLIMGVVFAIGHHFFLLHIDMKLTGNAEHQFWIRNASNAFAHVTVMCLGTAVSSALIQACWRAIKLFGVRLRTVDQMFSMPSPRAIKELLSSIRAKHALYLILIAVFMKALILVAILAPNALTIGFTQPVPLQMAVPSMNLGLPLYEARVTVWDNFVEEMLTNPPANTWSVPAGCGNNCSFDVVYQAPALSCRALQTAEFSLQPFDESHTATDNTTHTTGVQWTYYDTHSLLNVEESQWNGRNDTPFMCNYKPMTLVRSAGSSITVDYTSDHVGSLCHCLDATYQTTFSYANNQKNVQTTLLSYDNSFSGNCTWDDPSSLTDDCKNYATNSLQICRAFRDSFAGKVEYFINETISTVEKPSVLDKIVRIDANSTGSDVSLTPVFTNISEGLVSLFTNLTANLVPGLENTGTATAVVWSTDGIWNYSAVVLWAIYGPALFLSAIILGYGMYSIQKNGKALDNSFATLIMVARMEAMDDIHEIADEDEGSPDEEKQTGQPLEKDGRDRNGNFMGYDI